jgi:hypothetical protein
MLDPKIAGQVWQEHFDTVTPQEFAQELWGDRTVEEICADRPGPVRRAPGIFTSLHQSILRLFS